MFLAIIDLDGVVADNTKRFEKAEEAKQQWIVEHRVPGTNAILKEYGAPSANDIYWQRAFDSDLVALDTLIDGVRVALEALRFTQNYELIFLTSRPESMREATLKWLYDHNILFFSTYRTPSLVMKAPAFQFTKTTVWKAGMVHQLHRLYGADELLFIDDEEANRKAVLDAYPDGGDFGIVRVYVSLAEAVEALRQE